MQPAPQPETYQRRAERYEAAAAAYAAALKSLEDAARGIRLTAEHEPHPFPPDHATELALALARKALQADFLVAQRYAESARRFADVGPHPVPAVK